MAEKKKTTYSGKSNKPNGADRKGSAAGSPRSKSNGARPQGKSNGGPQGKSGSRPQGKAAGKPSSRGNGASLGKSNSSRPQGKAAGKSSDKRGTNYAAGRETLNQYLASQLQKALDADYIDKPSGKKNFKKAGANPQKRITGTITKDTHESKVSKKQRGFAAMAEASSRKKDRKGPDAPTPQPVKAERNKKSPCPVDHLCGGCSNCTIPYDKQLKVKTAQVKGLLWESGLPFEGVEIRPILGMDDPLHYRNKVSSPFARGKKLKDAKGKTKADAKDKGRRRKLDYEVLTGMYMAGTHQLVNTDGCLIENQQANRIIKVIKNLMIAHGMQPYDEDSGEGFLRHVVVRVGHNSGEVLVTLVTNGREFTSSKAFCRELINRCPYVTTVVQNINTRQTNVILGQEEQVLYGPGFILDTLCDLSFRISSQSFYQVNATQTEVLYRTAIDFAQLSGSQTVIDAYCGTGTIGLVAAKNGAAQVIGVDNVAQAIHDAKNNAQHNNVENSLFMVGDAGQVMKEWAAEGKLDPANTVLMMDPPRAGSSTEFLDAACQLGPARIVYISCNPETQMRDMKQLISNGYQLKIVQPVDMFPLTDHVETVALLTREDTRDFQ